MTTLMPPEPRVLTNSETGVQEGVTLLVCPELSFTPPSARFCVFPAACVEDPRGHRSLTSCPRGEKVTKVTESDHFWRGDLRGIWQKDPQNWSRHPLILLGKPPGSLLGYLWDTSGSLLGSLWEASGTPQEASWEA